MVYIDVPDMNDSLSAIELEGEEYNLRFTYNETYDYWNFGIYDGQEKPIVAMTKIVPGFNLLWHYTDVSLPPGVFGCLSDNATIGRNDFLNGSAEFLYLTKEEVEQAQGEEAGWYGG